MTTAKKTCSTEHCGRPCVGFMSICKACYQRDRRKRMVSQKNLHIGKNEVKVVGGRLIIDGLWYKIGHRGKAFYFDREWKLSSRDPRWVAEQLAKV